MPLVSSSGPSVSDGCSGCDMIECARCACGSTPPVASMTRADGVGKVPGAATATMRSPSTPMSHAPTPPGVITCPPRITRSSMAVSSPACVLRLHSQICALDVLVAEQLPAGAHQHYPPVLEHVAARGQGQRLARVLLHQHHRGPRAIDVRHRAEYLLYHHGR